MKTTIKTHVGAYGVIVKENKIALIKKARGGYTGKLDLPGGGIEHTELPEETLKRELMEEIGCKVKCYELMDVTATNIKWLMEEDLWEDLHHIGILYKVNLVSDNLKKETDGIDSNGASWYSIDDLKDDELSPFAKVAINKIRMK